MLIRSVDKAALCAGCSAIVPNTWTDPTMAVTVADAVYCSEQCIPTDLDELYRDIGGEG